MLNHLNIKGYKSIKSTDLDLGPMNILIGGNGSGKSNFLSFFKLVGAIFQQRFQAYALSEGADKIFHYGRKNTDSVFGRLIFSEDDDHNNAYFFELAPTREGGYLLS